MSEGPGTGDEVEHCACCEAQHAEVRRLRARLAQLEADKEALLRSAITRDYEPPPHYR